MEYRKTIILTFEPKKKINPNNEEYWEILTNYLNYESGKNFSMKSFNQEKYFREIRYVDGQDIIIILHEWDSDGTSTKPETNIEFNVDGNYNTKFLGRFSIWSEGSDKQSGPHAYAEDIMKAIENE